MADKLQQAAINTDTSALSECSVKGLDIKEYLEWDEKQQSLILRWPNDLLIKPPVIFGRNAINDLLKFIEEHRKDG